jgi:hypothetical protein
MGAKEMPKSSVVVGLHDALRTIKAAKAEDLVFFTKDQLKVGSILKYYGRHEPNTTWEVKAIWHFIYVKPSLNHPGRAHFSSKKIDSNPRNGYYRRHKVASVNSLADQVEIICKEIKQKHMLEFGYISYSAIWRLS